MSQTSLATVRLRARHHRAFGKLSGDVNAIHYDKKYARRTFAGEPVAHGVNLLTIALDAHFKSARGPVGPLTVAARFLKPAFLDESIDVSRISDAEGGWTKLTVAGDGATLAEIVLTPRDEGDTPTPPDGTSLTLPEPVAPRRQPATLALEDAEGAGGAMTPADAKLAGRLFPKASRALGPQVVAAIARLSGIIGMECPGRDSLLSQITIDVTPGARASAMHWHVTRVDRLLRLVRLSVRTEGINGTVQAFVRRPAPPPPDMASIVTRVTAGEFAGQTALIIGGSRGLGAATAALVAAGGGLAVLTYHSSGEDAAALQKAIKAGGFSAETLRFDASQKSDTVAKLAKRFGVTHLYYFATPKIFTRRREPFDITLFHRFAEAYVDGFAHVCAAVASAVPSVAVFYPSSTALAEMVPDLTEYAAAKAAGETVCDVLPRTLPGLTIMRMRLPRTTTDQTASLIAASAADPVEVMLPIIRELHQAGAAVAEFGRA